MGLLESALSKLTLIAFQDRECTKKIGSPLKVMYNPASVELGYTAAYNPQEYINSQEKGNDYQQVRLGELNLELILDAQLPGNQQSVDGELSTLRAMCFDIDHKTGEPPFIRIEWGKMNWHGHGYFAGRATGLAVSYTLFNRSAKPLRATARLSLSADNTTVSNESKSKAPSSVMMKAVARNALPVMAAVASVGVAVGQTDYLSLAYQNDLNNLSGFKPGDTLIFGASKG